MTTAYGSRFRDRVRSTGRFLVCLLFLAAVSSRAQAQIAFDASSSANTGAVDQTSLTWSHTVGAGSNRILVVGVSIRNSAGQTVSSVTYAGVGLTFIGAQSNGTNSRIEMWRLLAPATGTNSIVVTMSAGAHFVGGAASFTGVDQTTPLGTFVSATGNTSTPTVNASSATGEVVIDTLAMRGSADTITSVGAGQTQRWANQMPAPGAITTHGVREARNLARRASRCRGTCRGTISGPSARFP